MELGLSNGNLEDEITARVVSVVADVLVIEKESIGMDSSLVNDLGATSLDLVQLLWNLEEEFKESIPDADVGTFLTPHDVVQYIIQRIGEASIDET